MVPFVAYDVAPVSVGLAKVHETGGHSVNSNAAQLAVQRVCVHAEGRRPFAVCVGAAAVGHNYAVALYHPCLCRAVD